MNKVVFCLTYQYWRPMLAQLLRTISTHRFFIFSSAQQAQEMHLWKRFKRLHLLAELLAASCSFHRFKHILSSDPHPQWEGLNHAFHVNWTISVDYERLSKIEEGASFPDSEGGLYAVVLARPLYSSILSWFYLCSLYSPIYHPGF